MPSPTTSIGPAALSAALVALALLGACSNPERCFDASCLTGSGGSGAQGGSGGTGAQGGGGSGGGGAGTPSPIVCGDGVVEGDELCDGENFDGQTCASFGLPPSKLLCYGDCTLNAAFCGGTCNGMMTDQGETCDGLASAQCADLVGAGVTGTPICSPLCVGHDTSSCMLNVDTCGDLAVQSPEQCDGVPTTTCENVGFAGGTMACHPNCTFDTSACHRCGDGIIHPGEQCDGAALGPTTCESLAYAPGGTLACAADCTFDVQGCVTCGNGTLNLGEECDGDDHGGLTCADLGYAGGDLACDDACEQVLTGCF